MILKHFSAKIANAVTKSLIIFNKHCLELPLVSYPLSL